MVREGFRRRVIGCLALGPKFCSRWRLPESVTIFTTRDGDAVMAGLWRKRTLPSAGLMARY